jgi:hypothetical protein
MAQVVPPQYVGNYTEKAPGNMKNAKTHTNNITTQNKVGVRMATLRIINSTRHLKNSFPRRKVEKKKLVL